MGVGWERRPVHGRIGGGDGGEGWNVLYDYRRYENDGECRMRRCPFGTDGLDGGGVVVVVGVVRGANANVPMIAKRSAIIV